MQSKCRIVYDVEAQAFEESAPNLHGEYRRRARIGTGGFQAISMLWPLLGPNYGWTAFTFWSHKVLRWACPCFMIGALLCAAVLANHTFYRELLVAQGVFYALCLLGSVPGTTTRAMKPLRVLTMFASMNFALLIGFVRWVGQNQNGLWSRTSRAKDQCV